MIIQCPSCNRRFELRSKPGPTFCCPRCRYTTSFSEVLSKRTPPPPPVVPPPNPAPVTQSDEATRIVNPVGTQETRIVEGLGGDKTRLVPNLQVQKRRGLLQVNYKGTDFGLINLPQQGTFTVGRGSADSTAQIKLTPDITMSRIHAGIRVVADPTGGIVFQITSAKAENPVYVNGCVIPKGKPHNLKTGDKIRMGETDMVFKQM